MDGYYYIMNVFYLDSNVTTCAQYHCDKHVVKMIIEYAQLMSTAHRVLDGEEYVGKSKMGRRVKRWKLSDPTMEQIVYKACHVNHPSGVWTRASKNNYIWLYDMWYELCHEYTYRYGRTHATYEKLVDFLKTPPKNIPNIPMTVVPQAMPDSCKMPLPIDGYRKYYSTEKKSFAKWTKREIPEWFDAKLYA